MVSAQFSLNLFDGIVFAVLILCAILSLFRGFIREVLSLVAWVGASLFTLYKAQAVTELLKPTLKSETAAAIVGTLLCYFGALIIISIFNAVLLRYIKPGKEVGGIDNLLGLVFGFVKGAMLVILGFFILTLICSEATYPDMVKHAYTRPYVEAATRAALPYLPKYLADLSSLSKKDNEAADAEATSPQKADSMPSMQTLQRLLNHDRSATEGDGSPKVVTP